jgi:hypothetical protein
MDAPLLDNDEIDGGQVDTLAAKQAGIKKPGELQCFIG